MLSNNQKYKNNNLMILGKPTIKEDIEEVWLTSDTIGKLYIHQKV